MLDFLGGIAKADPGDAPLGFDELGGRGGGPLRPITAPAQQYGRQYEGAPQAFGAQ
jgi:hypothetical protein